MLHNGLLVAKNTDQEDPVLILWLLKISVISMIICIISSKISPDQHQVLICGETKKTNLFFRAAVTPLISVRNC